MSQQGAASLPQVPLAQSGRLAPLPVAVSSWFQQACSSWLLGGRTCLQAPCLDPLALYNSLQTFTLPHQVSTRLTRCKHSTSKA